MGPSIAHTWTPFSLQKPDMCCLRSGDQIYLGKCFLDQKDARKCQQLDSVDNCSSVYQPLCWLCIIYEYTYSLHWTTGHICNQEITLCQSRPWGSGMGLFKLLEWHLQGLCPVPAVTLPVTAKHSSREWFTSSRLALQDREYYEGGHQLFLARHPKLLRTVTRNLHKGRLKQHLPCRGSSNPWTWQKMSIVNTEGMKGPQISSPGRVMFIFSVLPCLAA